VDGYERLITAIGSALRWLEDKLIDEGRRYMVRFDFPNSPNKTVANLWSEDYAYAQAHVYPLLAKGAAIDAYREQNGWYVDGDEWTPINIFESDCYQRSVSSVDVDESAEKIVEFLIMHGVQDLERATVSFQESPGGNYGAPVPL